MKVLITFENRFDATLFAKVLKDAGVRCLMMPTPRTLSASCGVCAVVDSVNVTDIIKNHTEIKYQEMYKVKNDTYTKLKRS